MGVESVYLLTARTVLQLAAVLLIWVHPATAAERVALLIGNSTYTTPGMNLRNPVNDVTALGRALRTLGFEVYDPDMSMFTLGGGGVHCLSQALCRNAV